MDSGEHKSLVNAIREVHEKLRKALYSSGDPNKVWAEHLKEQKLRENYSVAMFRLATEAWKGKESRIDWAYKTCLDYFLNGGLERSIKRQRLKEVSQKKFVNLSLSYENEYLSEKNNYRNLNRKLKLLDVGSCFNPFSKFEEFFCIPIDLTPATKDVFQCDFLEVEIKPKNEYVNGNHSTSSLFYEESFDVVVLSLVLEYLPAPQQRAMFCYKSWQLLQENGLCIVITPDSKSVNHNVHMMKSWKLALEKIGFLRVKYDKLKHIHCIAFRKIKKEAHQSFCYESISELMFIPQDFKIYTEKEDVSERTEKESYDIYSNFLELPNEDLF